MAAPVMAKVNFKVSIAPEEMDGFWIVRTSETGIITAGATREEAELAASEANIELIAGWKAQGSDALRNFLTLHDIRFEEWEQPASEPEMLTALRATLRSVKLRNTQNHQESSGDRWTLPLAS